MTGGTRDLKLKPRTVALARLLVDPNNYRLDYGEDEEPPTYPDSEIVALQEETLGKLEKEMLGELRNSILRNGFLEIDRIVVRPLEDPDPARSGLYVVVEGNRRTAALKGLVRDYASGLVDLGAETLEKAEGLSVLCIDAPPDEVREIAAGLMGTRHVSGPKKWTGYQSARLIAWLVDRGRTLVDIAALLGIDERDAMRRLRGYRAVVQMRNDELYGQRVESKHYTLLLEFLAPRKAGRDWLGWDDEACEFKNDKNRRRLYAAIAPAEGVSAEVGNPADARSFLRCLESEIYRELIEEGVGLNELPLPAIEPGTAQIKNRIKVFLMLIGAPWAPEDEDERSLLREVQDRIGAILATERGAER